MSTTTATPSTQIFGADTGFLIACLVIGLIIMISLFVWGIVARPKISDSEKNEIKEEIKEKERSHGEHTHHKKHNVQSRERGSYRRR